MAQLAGPMETVPSELVDLINKNINPPAPVRADDVYVRAMFVVSDQVNSFGGRFPSDEHKRLASLLIDSPVMVGHRKDKLPVGRNFHAVTMVRNGENWVKSYFYWLKNSEGATNLKENIDGGIYKECSIGFTYNFPECSVCGKDIRVCRHEPLQEYRQGGTTITCYFNYRQIERVLETSLVYRGAVPDTSVSRELVPGVPGGESARQDEHDERLVSINDLAILDPSGRYLVVPRYEGVPVTVTAHDCRIVLRRLDGSAIDQRVVEQFLPARLNDIRKGYALLVGYMGKERSSRGRVEQYLAGDTSSVSRLVLTLYPTTENNRSAPFENGSGLFVKMIPHRVADFKELHRRALEIKTRDGVEIWLPDSSPIVAHGYLYQPSTIACESDGYTLAVDDSTGSGLLVVRHKDKEACFEVVGLDCERWLSGGRFVAREIKQAALRCTSRLKILRTGDFIEAKKQGDSLQLDLCGKPRERLILRPIVLDGRKQYLFFRQCS